MRATTLTQKEKRWQWCLELSRFHTYLFGKHVTCMMEVEFGARFKKLFCGPGWSGCDKSDFIYSLYF